MRSTNLNLIMQKGSRVVQMIIAQKVFILFTYLKDENKKKFVGSGTQYIIFSSVWVAEWPLLGKSYSLGRLYVSLYCDYS